MAFKISSFDYEYISSRKNRRVTDAASLSERKYRERTGVFAAEGVKLLGELISNGISPNEVFFTERAYEQNKALIEKAASLGADMLLVTDEVAAKLSEERAPQGVFSTARLPKKEMFSEELARSAENGFVVLDSVQDPGNVGTVIRTAVSLGISDIVLCGECADIWSRKTQRGAMGALLRANIYFCESVDDCVRMITEVGRKIYAAALHEGAKSASSFDFEKGDSVLIGNEGHGLSDKTVSLCTDAVIIPMKNGMDSLNAGIAAAILIWKMSMAQ